MKGRQGGRFFDGYSVQIGTTLLDSFLQFITYNKKRVYMKENPSVLELFLYSLPDGAGFPGMRFDRAEYLGVPTKIASGHVRHLLPVPWPWGDWGRLVLFPHSSPQVPEYRPL
jgi:hypothetical protein